MKNDQEIKTYRISGLDCANCAGRIEGALQKLEGMKSASVSFATETLRLPTDNAETLRRVQEVIRRTEPDARLVIPDGPDGPIYFPLCRGIHPRHGRSCGDPRLSASSLYSRGNDRCMGLPCPGAPGDFLSLCPGHLYAPEMFRRHC